jgi:outer membrane receptor protein involved in Fe transport
MEAGVEGTAQIGSFDTFFASDTNHLGQVEPDRFIKKDLTSLKGALFGTLVASVGEHWDLSAGARIDYFDLNRNTTVSPRLALSYSPVEDLTLHLRGGLFTQQLPLIVLSGNETFESLPVARATHVGLGADYMLRPDTKLTIEAYVKEYSDLPLDMSDPTSSVVDDALFSQRFTIYSNLVATGKAYTRGVEFILQRKMTEGIYGLVSGSYARCRYQDALSIWRDRVYDNRWIFSVIGGYKPDQNWEYGIRWTYAGGVPYTPFDQTASTVANIGITDQSKVQAARYPDYHSLNLRVDRKWYFDRHMLDIYLSVWNAYNHKNVAGYFWNSTENKQDVRYQWSVLPVLGVEYEF